MHPSSLPNHHKHHPNALVYILHASQLHSTKVKSFLHWLIIRQKLICSLSEVSIICVSLAEERDKSSAMCAAVSCDTAGQDMSQCFLIKYSLPFRSG